MVGKIYGRLKHFPVALIELCEESLSVGVWYRLKLKVYRKDVIYVSYT